jgi:hypothetical protein
MIRRGRTYSIAAERRRCTDFLLVSNQNWNLNRRSLRRTTNGVGQGKPRPR